MCVCTCAQLIPSISYFPTSALHMLTGSAPAWEVSRSAASTVGMGVAGDLQCFCCFVVSLKSPTRKPSFFISLYRQGINLWTKSPNCICEVAALASLGSGLQCSQYKSGSKANHRHLQKLCCCLTQVSNQQG